jgi:GntR family transcriptional regulator
MGLVWLAGLEGCEPSRPGTSGLERGFGAAVEQPHGRFVDVGAGHGGALVRLAEQTSNLLRRENVFYADDDPVHRVTTYIPWSIARGTGLLKEEVPHQYGIHGVLEDRHHTMTRIREEVSARMPRPEESRYLKLRPGVPVIDIWHTSIDQSGEPYELTRFVMRGDMTGLLYDVPVE